MSLTNDTAMDYKDICSYLPHRYPFLLIDRVVSVEPEKHIHAIKCVSGLDPYFKGHFPNDPVFPGVYLIEGLAQAGALLCFKTIEKRTNSKVHEPKCILTGVQESRFRKPVVPGDVLHYHAYIEKDRNLFVWMYGHIEVNNETVAEIKLSAMISAHPAK